MASNHGWSVTLSEMIRTQTVIRMLVPEYVMIACWFKYPTRGLDEIGGNDWEGFVEDCVEDSDGSMVLYQLYFGDIRQNVPDTVWGKPAPVPTTHHMTSNMAIGAGHPFLTKK